MLRPLPTTAAASSPSPSAAPAAAHSPSAAAMCAANPRKPWPERGRCRRRGCACRSTGARVRGDGARPPVPALIPWLLSMRSPRLSSCLRSVAGPCTSAASPSRPCSPVPSGPIDPAGAPPAWAPTVHVGDCAGAPSSSSLNAPAARSVPKWRLSAPLSFATASQVGGEAATTPAAAGSADCVRSGLSSGAHIFPPCSCGPGPGTWPR
jgi:hypothetical protein